MGEPRGARRLQRVVGARSESHASAASWTGESEVGFRCECEDVACAELLPLTSHEWQQVRSDPRQFVVAPHHVAADVESVVLRREDYWIVEKLGEAGEEAERLA